MAAADDEDATAAASSGSAVQVSIFSAVGTDQQGDICRATLSRAGVATEGVCSVTTTSTPFW